MPANFVSQLQLKREREILYIPESKVVGKRCAKILQQRGSEAARASAWTWHKSAFRLEEVRLERVSQVRFTCGDPGSRPAARAREGRRI